MRNRSDRPLSTAVIGCGAFGRNHARVYHELEKAGEPLKLAAVVDTNPSRVEALAREFNCAGYPSVDALLSSLRIDAASVAVPTLHHAAVARELMQSGVDILLEKPLTSTLAEADALIQLASRENRIAQVGHLERFNPAVQATLPLITKPMFFEVHRLSVFTPRSLDVDVVLDLMIHDLDAVLALVQSPVKEIRAAGLPILSNKVDIANARIEFESGCVANLTASRVSTERVRKLRFFQPRQYISIDYGRQDVLIFTVGDSLGTPSPNADIKMSKPSITPEEPLRAELRAFLDAVRTRKAPLVGLEDGRRALAVALEVLAQISAHADKLGLAGPA
jgi:predicted dehydrogenase